MSLTDYELAPAARRVMNIFLLIDTSSSMSGEKIAAVNDAIRNVIPIVDDISQNNPDAEIHMAALKFDSTVKWITPNPLPASQMTWSDQTACGFTAMGEACRELNNKLSHKHGFMKSSSGSFAPVVIMLSDGAPTDDFHGAMTLLENNKWFTHATRIAIAIGSDADTALLAKFTGNPELVLRVNNVDALKTLIKVTIVTSSMVNSSSCSVAAMPSVSGSTTPGSVAVVTKQAMTANAIGDAIEDIDGLSVGEAAMMDSLDFDDFD